MNQTDTLRKYLLPAIAVVLVAIAAVVILVPKPASGLTGEVVGDAFLIDTQDMASEVEFVSYEGAAGNANLMVVKSGDKISCKLDTCNSCNGSPVAYYEPLGPGAIACQNCGFDFDLANLDAAKGGCSPMDVPYTVEDGVISLSVADLDARAPLFSNIVRPA